MGSMPYALSVHSLVNSAGADVGFASLLGLAILVLLFFSQARETATLRDRLDESSQRVDSLEGQLAALQRAQSAPPAPPQPAQAPAPKPAAAAAAPALAGATITASRGAALLPGAPAGVAAPALAAATKLIPTVTPEPLQAPQPVPAAVPVGAASAPTAAGATAATAAGATAPTAAGAMAPGAAGATATPPSEDTVIASPAPATVAAAAANGHAQTPPAPPPPPPARAPVRAAAGSPGNGATGAAGPARAVSPLRAPARRRPSLAPRLVPALIGLGAVAVIVLVLIVVTSSGGGTPAPAGPSTRSAGHAHNLKPVAVFNPGTVTVAVLNGTAVTNLAHDLASRLDDSGYKTPTGLIATAADQTHATTLVEYLPGHQYDARKVAAALGLKAGAVQPADQQSIGVCAGSAGSCPADVIVTVGADLASAAPTTTT